MAAEGMFGNLNPLGDGPGRGLADQRERRMLRNFDGETTITVNL